MSSRRTTEDLDNLRNEPGKSVKVLGSQTNSMLLQAIQSESHRNAEIALNTYQLISELRDITQAQQESISQMSVSIRELTEALASNAIRSSSTMNSSGPSMAIGKVYYYKGTKLNVRYTTYACIIAHIIQMVYAHMRSRTINYPDSSDCEFNELVVATQTVCKEKCSIRTIDYTIPIEMTGKKKQIVIESLYKHIGSTSESGSATVLESSLGKIYNDSTREDIFIKIGRIMERLSYLPGILSPKQMDAMRSIRYPIVISRDDEPLRLNCDPEYWKGGKSHPISNNVMQRKLYIFKRLWQASQLLSHMVLL
jgi:hypothetical protein